MSSHLRNVLASLGVAALCAAAPATASAAPRASVTAAGPSSPGDLALRAASSGTCTLPVTYDEYQGFRVGVPNGWDVSTLGGLIAVSKTAAADEGAIIYPAALTKSMTPASFFNSYIQYQRGLLAKEGVTLSFKMQAATGGLPLASIQLRSRTGTLTGFARAFLLPLRTQLASKEVVFSAWWAPPSRVAADSATLSGISNCYSPATAEIYSVLRDQSFTYLLPPGWRVASESQDSLYLVDKGNDASVYYLFYGIPPQFNTPARALAHILAVLGASVTQVLSLTTLPNQQLSTGGVQGQEYEEFLGKSQGKPVHALLSILSDSGAGPGTFGVLRLGAASPSQWNSDNGGLVEMMGAIQHSFVQDLQQIQHLDQQWQQESAQEANFDDIINGYQLTQDPSTGQPYLVPLGSYGDCPNGEDYCLPSGQALNPISH